MIPVSYLLGSIPSGLIIVRLFKRVDVRDYGSGKTGMTNVLRTLGVPAAAVVLILDMAKAILSISIARYFFDSDGLETASALAVLIGHNWPVFVGFRGGRGTAPGLGGLFILSPLAGLVAVIFGVPTIATTRYVSLGSIVGTLSGAGTLIVLASIGRSPVEYIAYGVIGAAIIIGLHKDNIKRLLAGEERKLGQPAAAPEDSPPGGAEDTVRRWPKSA
jgi:glycerol-3-phosphate acyltransferase PlsY